MSGSRGEATSGLQHTTSRLASAHNNTASTLPSYGAMTRIPERVSNGPPSEGKSLADLINSSNLNARKRKLADAGEDMCSRRKRIAQHKAVRLKRVKKNYVQCATEFLTNECASANIWDDSFRKCPDIPTYLNYFKNNPLDPSDEKEDLIMLVSSSQLGVASTSSTPSLFSVPEPDNSSTPSASSPDKRLQSPLKSPATTPTNHNRSLTPPQRPQTSFDTQEQIVEKAKQEAQVMQRINELQREGLWAEKRLPKVQEPPRVKAHWDYLLEEMVWLAADFAQERKWKKAAAKKCAKMVQKYFQDKELMAQKAVKSQEMQLKRIASTMAKEVKQFWANVEKLVEYKQQTRLEEKRKKALDQHLSFIVDQTEKYSSLVAESMNKTGADTSLPPSPSGQHHTSDVEFEPGGDSSDDEETIAKAEAEDEKEPDKTREIELLQQESELPLDELLKDYMDKRDQIVLEEEEEDDASEVDKDEEFRASDKDTSDDEETIQEQEKAEGKVDHKQELDDLKAEGEMNIEELKAKYANLPINGTPMEEESQSSETTGEDGDEDEEEDGEGEGEDEESESEEDVDMEVDEEDTTSQGLSSLLSDDTTNQVTEKDKDKRDAEINDVAALAESIQPKGNTLSSTSVVTKIPFLLKHTLREYQHIGLDWLVTMYDRKLNGILADEMGLGKTIQTISVLAHLACEKGNWGPHLIVVPTSVMLNWEMEFKKWCPAFKILTYYGTQKERKMKRTGWTKPNAFHVCITSYKLVIQDHQSFRRKAWKYLILDEAQNIKNFKSQRWQLLLNFQTQRRLLLTGTPLQNNLMELWSLMHFLMPNVFQSHREFKEWFSNPVTGMIEGNSEYNEQIIKRLHKVLRPFLLRRLKCEVEKQLPKKYEHVVMCRLSNRQRYLYDDFMSRAKTRETLATGNLLSVINVLMQLRKVCNHPNLFEVRPTVSPFQMEAIELFTASCVWTALDYDPFKHVSLEYLNLWKANIELWLSAFMAYTAHKLRTPARLIEEIDSAPPSPPPCPRGKIKLHVRFNHQPTNQQVTLRPGGVLNSGGVLRPRLGSTSLVRTAITNQAMAQGLSLRMPVQPGQMQSYAVQLVQRGGTNIRVAGQRFQVPAGFAQLVQTNTGRHILFTPSPPASAGAPTATAVMTSSGQRLILNSGALTRLTAASTSAPPLATPSTSTFSAASTSALASTSTSTSPVKLPSTATSSSPVTATAANSILVTSPAASAVTSPGAVTRARRKLDDTSTTTNSAFTISRLEEKRRKWRGEKLTSLAEVNEQRCVAAPMYGWDLVTALRLVEPMTPADSTALREMILGVEDRLGELHELINKFVLYVPAVKAPRTRFHVSHPPAWRLERERRLECTLEREMSPRAVCLHPIVAAMMTQFPDPSLIQYDCGKLQSLDRLLRTLKSGQHRVLIFTQMTRMLDVLEAFLNFHGHIYLRLDGTTKVDQRQVLMERFNGDKRIFCFILSTRSGGVGVNLTGADTVIFYDSDWNPTMDAQAQDRCHRIGQTRDVHIYRLVSEKTVEENILKKANQKRMLGDLAIEGGNFTTAYFKSTTIQDLFNVDVAENDASRRMAEVLERRGSQTQNPEDVQEKAVLGVLESAMAAAEDDTDVAAAKTAKAEAVADLAEFDETIPLDQDAETGEEISKAEQELNALVQQLSGVEKYAMKFIEETEAAWSAEQLAAAEAEIEQQKREWEEERLAALRQQEELNERDARDASEELLTYSREDAQNQVTKPTPTSLSQVKLNNTSGAGGVQPRTRSKATVQINLWTLDEKEQADRKRERKPGATSTPTPAPKSTSTPKSTTPVPKTSTPTPAPKNSTPATKSTTNTPAPKSTTTTPAPAPKSATTATPAPAPKSTSATPATAPKSTTATPATAPKSTTPTPMLAPTPPPYSNPNLVIRTRRSSTNPIVSKASWDELTNHVSDPCLVGRKLARLNKAKRRSSVEGNGPVL